MTDLSPNSGRFSTSGKTAGDECGSNHNNNSRRSASAGSVSNNNNRGQSRIPPPPRSLSATPHAKSNLQATAVKKNDGPKVIAFGKVISKRETVGYNSSKLIDDRQAKPKPVKPFACALMTTEAYKCHVATARSPLAAQRKSFNQKPDFNTSLRGPDSPHLAHSRRDQTKAREGTRKSGSYNNNNNNNNNASSSSSESKSPEKTEKGGGRKPDFYISAASKPGDFGEVQLSPSAPEFIRKAALAAKLLEKQERLAREEKVNNGSSHTPPRYSSSSDGRTSARPDNWISPSLPKSKPATAAPAKVKYTPPASVLAALQRSSSSPWKPPALAFGKRATGSNTPSPPNRAPPSSSQQKKLSSSSNSGRRRKDITGSSEKATKHLEEEISFRNQQNTHDLYVGGGTDENYYGRDEEEEEQESQSVVPSRQTATQRSVEAIGAANLPSYMRPTRAHVGHSEDVPDPEEEALIAALHIESCSPKASSAPGGSKKTKMSSPEIDVSNAPRFMQPTLANIAHTGVDVGLSSESLDFSPNSSRASLENSNTHGQGIDKTQATHRPQWVTPVPHVPRTVHIASGPSVPSYMQTTQAKLAAAVEQNYEKEKAASALLSVAGKQQQKQQQQQQQQQQLKHQYQQHSDCSGNGISSDHLPELVQKQKLATQDELLTPTEDNDETASLASESAKSLISKVVDTQLPNHRQQQLDNVSTNSGKSNSSLRTASNGSIKHTPHWLQPEPVRSAVITSPVPHYMMGSKSLPTTANITTSPGGKEDEDEDASTADAAPVVAEQQGALIAAEDAEAEKSRIASAAEGGEEDSARA